MADFSPQNSLNPKVDYATTDGAGNKIASVADTVNEAESRQEDSRARAEAFVDVRFTAKDWKTLRPRMMKRPAQKATEFDSAHLVDVTPHEGKKIFFDAEFSGLCSMSRLAEERANPAMALPEIEWPQLSGGIFQVLKEAHGSQERELQLHLGSGSFDFIAVQELFEPTGNVQADKEITALADQLRAKRKIRSDAIAKAPKPVDPRADFAAAVGAGVVQALAALGIKPNPTKP